MVSTEISRNWRWLGLLCLMFSLGVHAQTVRDEAVLFDKPEGKPGTIKLPAGSAIKTLRRQGFWVEVDAAGTIGWLKVSQISFAGAAGGATAIDTGRLGTGNIVATSAARGLSAKDLLSGQPNFNEVSKLDTLTAVVPSVQAFLAEGSVLTSVEKIQLSVPRPSAVAVPAALPQSAGTTSAGKKKGEDDW